jgi:hypothetical protein
VTRARKKTGVTFDTVRALALALPGVEEGTSYGTPAFKAGGKLLARLREDGESLVVHVDPDARDMLLRSDPEAFFITDHYAGYPLVLVRLARVDQAPLGVLLEEAWRSVAPKRLVAGSGGRAAPAGRGQRELAQTAPARGRHRQAKKPRTPADALARLGAICLAFPEAAEGLNHSQPCFEVRGKTFVMFLDNHHGDGRLALWCKAPPGAQAMIVESDPARFFVPPYVGPRGWIGARLDGDVDWSAIAACVEESYRMTAPKRVLAKLAR